MDPHFIIENLMKKNNKNLENVHIQERELRHLRATISILQDEVERLAIIKQLNEKKKRRSIKEFLFALLSPSSF